MSVLCPHCRLWHDGKIIRMCRDRKPWTDAERDQWREDHRRRYPGVPLVSASLNLSGQFGHLTRVQPTGGTT